MRTHMNTSDPLSDCSKDQKCIGVENDCTGLNSVARSCFNTVKKDTRTLEVPGNFQFDDRLCVHIKGVEFWHILLIIFVNFMYVFDHDNMIIIHLTFIY